MSIAFKTVTTSSQHSTGTPTAKCIMGNCEWKTFRNLTLANYLNTNTDLSLYTSITLSKCIQKHENMQSNDKQGYSYESRWLTATLLCSGIVYGTLLKP